MFARIFNAVGIIAVATLLAGGGFAGYLFGTGKLSGSRLELMTAVLRGELDPEPGEAVQEEAGVVVEDEEVRGQSAEQVRALRKRRHREKLEIERALADLKAQRRLLDQAMHQVVQEQEQLVQDRKDFEVAKQQVIEEVIDEGFQKELEYVTSLPPRQAKEHILRVWRKESADAVRLLVAMDVRQGKRILEQLKTAEELDIQTDLLEQIRLQGMEGYASTSGKTAGDAAP